MMKAVSASSVSSSLSCSDVDIAVKKERLNNDGALGQLCGEAEWEVAGRMNIWLIFVVYFFYFLFDVSIVILHAAFF